MVDMQDYVMTYSMTKLEETARTFRRLGEAYDTASRAQQDNPGISRQLFLVADVLEECTNMNVCSAKLDRLWSRDLMRKCLMAGIRVKNVQAMINNSGKKEIIITARTIGKGCVSLRKLLSALNSVDRDKYYADTSSRAIVNEEYSQYIFIQENRFQMLCGVARVNKDKESLNGDNYMISRLGCGKNIVAIADGMGSGSRAFAESRMVIELMENCIDSGFDAKASLELINSAYVAGGGSGNPVTMDMSIVDCVAGVLNCIKLGAVATFIKRDSMVEVIKSTTLPMGVLEKIDYDCTTKKLYDGDYVVMISDGLLDNLPFLDKEEKMADLINSLEVKEPNAMAHSILKESLQYNGMKPCDDMTVLVLGVFDTCDK